MYCCVAAEHVCRRKEQQPAADLESFTSIIPYPFGTYTLACLLACLSRMEMAASNSHLLSWIGSAEIALSGCWRLVQLLVLQISAAEIRVQEALDDQDPGALLLPCC
jgi:hypothetical protein